MQAKKVAEKASESVHDVGKTALEVSKSAADASKDTLDDLTFVSKSKMEDITQSAKNVVHKTHLNEVCYLLTYSFMFENYKIVKHVLTLNEYFNKLNLKNPKYFQGR